MPERLPVEGKSASGVADDADDSEILAGVPESLLGSEFARARLLRLRTVLHQRLSSVVVVVESVRRRMNTSAILRSCEAFGVHEVHMVTGAFRPAKGASRGSERWLDLHRHRALSPCVEALKSRGFRFFVADLTPGAFSPDTVPVEGPVAVLFGTELHGVSDEARALADGAICVPMWGLTESLNVSVAAACTLQRITDRRREIVGSGDLSVERQRDTFDLWVAQEVASRTGRRARTGSS